MYHSRKIGVFISHIMGHYQKNVCQGIIDKALEYGYTAEIFTTLDGEELGDYDIGEQSILNLPDYTDYCGIIFASETYLSTDFKEQILNALQKRCTCPVIEIAVANQHFPAIALFNNRVTEDIVRHLICAHHHRRICYLGSRSQAYFSDSRENYYRKAMKDAGLTVGPADVCSCGNGKEDIKAALAYFLAGTPKPDAIVCYNDEIALLLMQALREAGYRIPEDIAITGCDCTLDGQNASPSLTTVTFPVYELGVCAVETLLKKIDGKTIPAITPVSAHPVFGKSCGCKGIGNPDQLAFSQSLNRRIASLETSILSSMRMSAAFSRITDLEQGMDLLENYIHGIEHCREFYLCLYHDWDSISSYIKELTNQDADADTEAEEILLKLAIRDGKRLPECSFKHSAAHGLLPEHIYKQSNSAYIYNPLFFEDKEFGYVALAYENNRIDYHFQLVHWFLNINQMLRGICETKCNALLVHHLEDIYTKDTLTGLYNKHGFLQHSKTLLADAAAKKQTITAFLFDLDRLKAINDTYGHAEGDFALQVIGQALFHVIRPEDVCARFSGDEFYLLTRGYTKKDADALIAHVDKYLDNYNRLSTKGYPISASGGYASAPIASGNAPLDIDTLFNLADKEMYRRKKLLHNR